MKHLFTATIVAIIATVSVIGFSSFKAKKASSNTTGYQIDLVSTTSENGYQTWVWSLYNPNPGNGNDGTLQNLSHWDISLPSDAEMALVSAEYSTDNGITWVSVPLEMERDPAIRACTKNDVLKFNVGTIGTQTNLYRVVFNDEFTSNQYATSWVKTGGGLQGCNCQYFVGVGSSKLD